MNEYIKIRGARQHNLKNINLDIPKNKFVVLTGVSGSGKSSLAFDTIYAEGQRRYVESLSSYARQFLGVMEKPDVDAIEGLSPAISIDQKTTSHNPRSTVGTITEVYDYLRLLFARIGHPHCPICGREISSQSLDQITDSVTDLVKNVLENSPSVRFLILSPIVRDKKGEFANLLDNLRAKGFMRVRIDGQMRSLDEDLVLIKTNKHTIDAVVDRVSLGRRDLRSEVSLSEFKTRISDSVEQSLKLSEGLVVLSFIKDAGFEIPDFPKKMEDHLFSEKFSCPYDNIQLPEIEPRTFSFNSPHGACATCSGIGFIKKADPKLVFSDELSIYEGAILPFSNMFENDTWYSRLVRTVCEENNISLSESLKNLSEKDKNLLLKGTGEDRLYQVEGTNRRGKMTYIVEPFMGVLADLEKRYSETESEIVRAEVDKYMTETTCPSCKGARLKPEALGITVDDLSIVDLTTLSIKEASDWVERVSKESKMSDKERYISGPILKEIGARLGFLVSVGLDYLSLDRSAATLAGGEAQRIRLASQIGSGLTGVLYVLDEPTIGLHAKDNDRLINTLEKLRDLGNTVLVVEHDKETIKACDYVVDFGPGAGKLGGKVVAQGTPREIAKNPNSLTGQYLSGKREIRSKRGNNLGRGSQIVINGCNQYNLKNIDVSLPLGNLVVITGVSGSGKSTLLVETVYHALAQKINRYHRVSPGPFKSISGVENIDKVVLIDQSPIGRTPRSNPATYTGLFTYIREVYAQTKDAKIRGYKPGRFSFNVRGGRCESCEGQGQQRVEMQFMSDLWVICEVCKGTRYNNQTLEVEYRGKSIAQVLKMSVSEAKEHFHAHPKIMTKLDTLERVGLNYMDLGQSATTLSGGEAQRIKLATELSKRATGSTFYILDEPTTGLHFSDLEKLLEVLKELVERGNTVVVIEHNLDIIKNADWIIDLGPEGGSKGGKIVAQGTPKDIARNRISYTGQYLKNENL